MSLHHSEATHEQLIARVPQVTGRDLPEWFTALDDGPGLLRFDERVNWLRDEHGRVTRAFEHICWDGCMFPNAVMTEQKTWDDVLGVMIAVRDAHGYDV